MINKLGTEEIRELGLRIRKLEAAKEEIALFVELIKREGGIDYAERVMYDYRERALALLPASTEEQYRTALTTYINYVIERNK